ncbi:HAD-IA family hydrolase [Pediococcus cellicola]|uniref:p-Ser-HPr phosphatase n=1 Tax=Pediococcus cellicola TaxID=319652 RepID=A0A0R2IQV3_9LACO|nr:HAD-IA family hydrolase [Pediococcus cellicola]KRN67553.1 hypothetical protein IV80_GL000094 [Pediococcus cellicola]GEL14459.1 phosphoglycolate phosphatase [Pediococcus cellicola]
MDLFWDFDGTLFDTYPVMVKSFQKTLTHFGVTNFNSIEIYQTMRQYSLGKAIDKYRPKQTSSSIFRTSYRRVEDQYLNQAKPFDNALKVCQRNVQASGRNFLLTHRNDQAKQLLDDYKFTSLFSGFVTENDHFPRKPDPASLVYLIQKFQVNKKAAIMIGDRNLDILAAHNAGIKGILFDPDNCVLVESAPERQIQQLSELLSEI